MLALMAFLPVAARGGAHADTSSAATLPKPRLVGAAWTTAEIAELRHDIDERLRENTALMGAHLGLYAVDARTGTVLYARAADDDFTPASNEKVITGSAALARLGRNFRFHTTLFAQTPPHGGAVDGDLILRGGGDTLLRMSDLSDAAAALAERGVSVVHGGIRTDTSYFDEQRYGDGWVIDDLPYDYAAPISALSLEDNAVHFTVRPGGAVGASASFTPTASSLGCVVRSTVVTGARGSADTVAPAWKGDGVLYLAGSIPLGSVEDTIDAAVPDPPAYAAHVLRQALNDHGVTVEGSDGSGNVAAGATQLWVRDSEPLERLLADFWYPSDNLVGESLLKALGVAFIGIPGRNRSGLAAETAFLRSLGVDTSTVSLFDGSGLSRYDELTPRALVAVLQYDFHSPDREVVLDALPVAGVRGTLKDRFIGTPAQGRVFAKTGGMLNVTNLSGYIATKRHGTVIFSFLIDNALGDDAPIAAMRSRIFSCFIES
jgi:serine-type D-Ala-D-Ala carboxypeptidase/endopeptidase (penicillin-binding protein 4)